MDSIFDVPEITRRCEDFFSIYDEGESDDRLRAMCEAKIIHSRYVAQNCTHIAESLGFDPYDTDLAWIIGELHDFARFGQIVVTRTFRDTYRWNHAHLGASLLFKHRLIDDIIPNYEEVPERDRKVMKEAVYHHSDFHLPEDKKLSERERTFCQLIRDADQLDIFRTIVESGWLTIYSMPKEVILSSGFSKEIEAAFYNHELADYSKRKTPADFHLAHIALCFGLKSRAARARAMEQGYLQRMMDITFTHEEVQRRYEAICEQVRQHLEECNEFE